MRKQISLFVLFVSCTLLAQQTKKMTLIDAIMIAKENSVDKLKFTNQYQSSYWDYQAYKTENLPYVALDLQPFTYNKQVIQRYNSLTNRDEYKNQQTLNVFGGLTIAQQIPLTGGSLYLESNIGKLTGFGYDKYSTFSSTFGRIGFKQPIFGYNDFKWRKKIEPLRFSKAQKELIANNQEINLTTLDLFFNLLEANQKLATAILNEKNAKQLYQIGLKRFEIAGIEKDELLQLELNVVNATLEIQQIKKSQSIASASLNSYLALSDTVIVEPIKDNLESIPDLKVDYQQAIELMKANNPEIEDFAQQLLESEQRIARAKGEGGVKINFSMSLGIDQQAEKLKLLYQMPPLDQQRVDIGIAVPILDWGRQHRNLQRVRMDLEVVKVTVKQKQQELDQRIRNLIQNFNLQSQVVQSAAKADAIAEQSFLLTNERFKLAETNVVALNAAITAKLNSQHNYFSSIRNYWEYLYLIQKMTGYDFIRKENLKD